MCLWEERARSAQAEFLAALGADFPLPWTKHSAAHGRACSRVLYLELLHAHMDGALTIDFVPGEGFLGIRHVRLTPEGCARLDLVERIPTIRGAANGLGSLPSRYVAKVWHSVGLFETLDADGCLCYAYRPEKRLSTLATRRRAYARRKAKTKGSEYHGVHHPRKRWGYGHTTPPRFCTTVACAPPLRALAFSPMSRRGA